ncbi:MAG TPA: AMP-binding protein [Bacteroidales bacterium]|jgi:long-chain acyl-CoA synthetase|nr:AMP-binding protein [Bacteroidales bacterium]HNX83499.1 AMP-binding protein [Bacteroidales bacterium]HOC48432.1 AMP-binding protein [Bacteroidales bacterium]HPS97135.1 AMP-binding protein [Bacteroidales bacterium]
MKTIVELLENSAGKYANNPYLLEKKSDHYESISYTQTRDLAYVTAAGLIAMGLQKGDRVALLSESRTDWVLSELGILHAGAICVPLSILLKEGADLKFRIDHSGSRWIIVSALQYEKIKVIRKDLANLEKIILLDQRETYDEDEIFMGRIRNSGGEYLKDNHEKFMERVNSVGPDDYANISYTSGTTADPKAIILSHRNYTANIEQTLTLMDVPEWWTTLLILPWDHSFAHTVGIYIMMATGASLAAVQSGKSYLDSIKNIPANIREIRPVFLLSAPALAKNFRKGIEKSIKEKGPVIEKLFRHALKIAYKYNGIGWDKGKGFRIFLKPLYMLCDLILFKKIRAGFGGRLKFFFGGAALLDIELQKFFSAIGIPMLQGYGLSEAAPVISGNVEKRYKLGSSGYVVKNLDLKICDEDGKELPAGQKGEIVIRGENVMKGYWKNERATREAIRDGWLFTGDMGYLDKDRFLYVLGRFKSLLISDDGEKYSPEGIEETITDRSPFIDQLMLFNNQNKFTTALLVPNGEALARWAKNKNIDISGPQGPEAVLNELDSVIGQYRTGGQYDDLFPPRWLPSAVGVLAESFNADNKLLNSLGKMVRAKIVERYHDRIDSLYSAEARNIVNPENLAAIKKVLGIR